MTRATYDFSSATAIITGAAGDIGGAVAQRLARAGAALSLWDLERAGEALRDSADRCSELGATAVDIVACDVTDEAAVVAAVDGVAATLGPARLLFNNAGYQGAFAPAADYPMDDAQRVLDVNVVGVLHVLAAVARRMRSSDVAGSIVNTASMAALGGPPNMLAYSASKAAVIGLTKTAARDLAPAGIRVNAVSPAFIGPGMMWDRQVELQAAAGSSHYSSDPDEVAAQMVGQVPLGRLGSVDEVAAAVVWLLSDEASYVTGTNLLVTGGIV